MVEHGFNLEHAIPFLTICACFALAFGVAIWAMRKNII